MMPNSSFDTAMSRVVRWLLGVATILAVFCNFAAVPAHAQANVLTQHNDNVRSGLNSNETILAPSNVNASTFGIISTLPVDGMVVAEPLFVSGVNIPGLGSRNVVFVATLHNSVYAFDADHLTNPNPLWQTNFSNPAAGVTTEPSVELGCTTTTFLTEMGILGTPVIDANSQTMYVLAKTKENGTYHFRFHALDLSTGMEKLGGPVDVNATVNGALGTLMLTDAAKNMMARPGLLLSQGAVYMAFGSNGCDGQNTRGWVVAYDASTLLQLGVFNDTLDTRAARGNIWQSGNGLASDDNGNIFFATANGGFDANTGGNDYGSSIMRIGWSNGGNLVAKDYFTPYNVNYLNSTDLDVGSAGVILLPDQPGPHPHLVVGSGKEGSVYVLDRDNMGQFNATDNNQIVQFIPFDGGTIPPQSHTPPGTQVGRMFSSPAYWNGYVYMAGQNQGISQFSLQNDQIVLFARGSTLCCAHTPSVSANGTTNGIVWAVNGNGFSAFDASDVSLPPLYSISNLGNLAHFNVPTVVNGKVFIGTKTSLQVLGLLANLQPASGNNQTVPALGTAPVPLTVAATDSYTGLPIAGVTVTFGDNKKGGVFNPPTAVTNSSGRASTSYTVPKLAATYTITASFPSSKIAKFTVTVVGGTPTHIAVFSGNKQVGALQSAFPLPLVVQVDDVYNNGVVGQTVTFAIGANSGTFSPVSVVTDSKGRAQTFYTSGTKGGALPITITTPTLHQGMSETVTPGPATAITILSGNSQKAAAGTKLAANLAAKVVDQYGNGIPGVSVTFSDGGVGGAFSVSPVTTDATGRAIVSYTLPSSPQVVHITASVSGLGSVVLTATAL